MKSIVVASAIREGLFQPNTKVFCENGSYKIGKRTIRDDYHKFGWLTVSDILALSSNIGVTKMAMALGPEKLRKALLDFGFGQRLGIDFPGETSGILHSLPWREHLMSNISFGHGLTVSALQMAAAYAAIASDGQLRTPYLVKQVEGHEGEQVYEGEPKVVRRVLSEDQAAMMRLMLTAATNKNATGFNARVPGFPVAGKTGTAQMVDPVRGGYIKGAYLSSFAGMIPANDPKLVIYIIVENPRSQYYASVVAAPIFSKVARFAMHKMGEHPILISEKDLLNKELAFNLNKTVVKKPSQSKKVLEHVKVADELMDLKNNEEGVLPDLHGLSLRTALKKLEPFTLPIVVRGSGVVARSYPDAGMPVEQVHRIRLYLQPEIKH
jgi:cell division protein FtsI (penicillin-binding protein 3)